MTAHLRSPAAYRARYPQASDEQWRKARNAANYRRRKDGRPEIERDAAPVVSFVDKKIGTTDWREISAWAKQGQDLRHKGSWNQHHATIHVDTPYESILLVPFGDAHLGSWGTSVDNLVSLTNEVLSNPRIYLGFLGDLVNLAIKLRGVLETKDDLLPPEMQHNLMDAWLLELVEHDKVLFAGWGNHDTEREEAGVGASIHQRMLNRHVPYFAGIGHVDLSVAGTVYRLALSHRFRGSTSINTLGGQKRYMRFEGQDREIALGGDLHRPCFESYFDGPTRRAVINCGALQTGSGYAQRYFSLYTIPEYPVIELFRDTHRFIVYSNLSDWQATTTRKASP